MKVLEGMNGRVLLVWQNINSPFFTDEEKGEAIRPVLDLATHNALRETIYSMRVSIFGTRFLRWKNEGCYAIASPSMVRKDF